MIQRVSPSLCIQTRTKTKLHLPERWTNVNIEKVVLFTADSNPTDFWPARHRVNPGALLPSDHYLIFISETCLADSSSDVNSLATQTPKSIRLLDGYFSLFSLKVMQISGRPETNTKIDTHLCAWYLCDSFARSHRPTDSSFSHCRLLHVVVVVSEEARGESRAHFFNQSVSLFFLLHFRMSSGPFVCWRNGGKKKESWQCIHLARYFWSLMTRSSAVIRLWCECLVFAMICWRKGGLINLEWRFERWDVSIVPGRVCSTDVLESMRNRWMVIVIYCECRWELELAKRATRSIITVNC